MASLLDTNIVSQLTKDRPDEEVTRWLRSQRIEDMFLSVVSLTEIRYGIDLMKPGRKQSDFEFWLREDLPRIFASRILPIDEIVANEGGRLLALTKAIGRKYDVADALIAATARVHGLKLATLNRREFEKLPVELVVF